MSQPGKQVVDITREYYDSDDADNFYHQVWGGEDIHIGIYEQPNEPIGQAGRRTVEFMASTLNPPAEARILDIGSGYGGAARFLAQEYNARVTCLNLSSAENQRNIEKNRAAGLDHKIKVVEGNFEELPFGDAEFDAIWSEDAILHSGNKKRVFQEVERVLQPGALFIFTDPMQADDCPAHVLEPVLNRIHLDSMGSFGLYDQLAESVGLQKVQRIDLSPNLAEHYGRVRAELERKRAGGELEGVSPEYCERMIEGLGHWIDAGQQGHLTWGVMVYKKP